MSGGGVAASPRINSGAGEASGPITCPGLVKTVYAGPFASPQSGIAARPSSYSIRVAGFTSRATSPPPPSPIDDADRSFAEPRVDPITPDGVPDAGLGTGDHHVGAYG